MYCERQTLLYCTRSITHRPRPKHNSIIYKVLIRHIIGDVISDFKKRCKHLVFFFTGLLTVNLRSYRWGSTPPDLLMSHEFFQKSFYSQVVLALTQKTFNPYCATKIHEKFTFEILFYLQMRLIFWVHNVISSWLFVVHRRRRPKVDNIHIKCIPIGKANNFY